MRIVIDMQGAQTESRFRGIGRYTMAFAQALARNRNGHEIVLALSGLFPGTIEPIRAAFDGLIDQDDIRVWYASGPVRELEPGNEWRRESAELLREAFLVSLDPDVIHVPSLFEGYVDDAVTSIGRFDSTVPVSVTIHDLIPLLYPEHYLKPNPAYDRYYRRKVDHIRQASLILGISESSCKEALACLGGPPDSIVNTSAAVDAGFRRMAINDDQAQRLLRGVGIARPFLLYTGGADERKNLPRLIQAYAQLPAQLRQRHQLVLAGKMPEGNVRHLMSAAKAAGLRSDEVHFTGYVSDEDLVQLYNLCTAFVFPSWHEGFGLPALEAMACGAPVIAADRASLPEVIGREDALFDPHDVAQIAEKMKRVIEDEAFRQALSEHGLLKAQTFSWDSSAFRAIEAFEGLCREHGKGGARREADKAPASTGAAAGRACTTALHEELVDRLSSVEGGPIEDGPWVELARAVAESVTPKQTQRQMLVDISELSQRDARSGIQRVVRSMLKQMMEHPPAGCRVEPVYATMDAGYRYARAFMRQFGYAPCEAGSDDIVEFQNGDIFLGLDYQAHVVVRHAAFFDKLRRFGARVYFLIHDLIPYRHPEWFYPRSREDFGQWLHVIAQGDGVLCVSRATADDFIAWFSEERPERLRPLNVGWFHNGADIDASLPSTGLPPDYDARVVQYEARPTFLMVGTIEPRKGHAQVLDAFERLWGAGTDINLVIVGKQGWDMDDLVRRFRSHPEREKRLFWLEGISDEYLEKLYGISCALIAASRAEGFGLPLIEAAKHGLPIIARDIPVFREVAGEHAFYFSGLEADALADALDTWFRLRKTGCVPSTDGLRSQTWAQSVERMLQVMFKDEWYRKIAPRRMRKKRCSHG